LKVLVTGANGFLAGNIIIELLSRNYFVRGMLRKTAEMEFEHTRFESFTGDISRKEEVSEAVRDCGVVIHSAAITDQSLTEYHAYEKINAGGTFNVLQACHVHKVKKLIYVSTANTFGYGSKEFPGSEDKTMRYPFTSSFYAASKAAAQDMLLNEHGKSETQITVVNPTFMIGGNDNKVSSNRIILRAIAKNILIIPPGGKNFIHVGDVAAGVCNAIEQGKDGECYILANENLSFREFYAKLSGITGQRPFTITVPQFILLLTGVAGDMLRYAGIRTSVSSVNMKIISLGNYYTGKKAVREINLPQTPVESAIEDALSWFRKRV